MDDFGAGGKIPDFDKIISTILSRDISVSLILQSMTQLESMYSPAEAVTIVNNCDHIIYNLSWFAGLENGGVYREQDFQNPR
ncbi:MAG: TraG/TraD/VirD4 family protein [Muribaculaceae bacterium]|nr:TraG/TraD/VirD4 family protein [Muribaculaceae bacterium]MCM1480192.1 TraG/TraD/VirD4 family protein [Muribaculaceae bacterium]